VEGVACNRQIGDIKPSPKRSRSSRAGISVPDDVPPLIAAANKARLEYHQSKRPKIDQESQTLTPASVQSTSLLETELRKELTRAVNQIEADRKNYVQQLEMLTNKMKVSSDHTLKIQTRLINCLLQNLDLLIMATHHRSDFDKILQDSEFVNVFKPWGEVGLSKAKDIASTFVQTLVKRRRAVEATQNLVQTLSTINQDRPDNTLIGIESLDMSKPRVEGSTLIDSTFTGVATTHHFMP